MTRSNSLSVGIPTYNHGPYVGATVRSLLDQTEAPFELVVCDNHSTDETAAVLAAFGERVRVIRPPRHLPMMENWNHLVGQLRGDWVALMSSDDLALPNYIASLWAGTRLEPDAVLVRANVEFIDRAGRSTGIGRPRPTRPSRPPRNLLERLYGPKENFNATAFRRDAWQSCGGFPESCRLAGDWGLWLELCPYGSFVTIPDIVARYRTGHRSESEEHGRLVVFADDFRAIYREIIPRIAEKVGDVRTAQIRDAMRSRCHNFLARLSRTIPPGERAELSDRLAQWARDCEIEAQLDRFRAGERFGRLRFRALRRLAARVGIG